MKKRAKKRTKNAASLARGHVRALAKRGIKIDKRGRARKDGKPLAKKKLERAVTSIKRAEKRKTPAKVSKPAAKPKVAPKAAPKKRPKELSERDAFIIESIRRNHLAPDVRKRYFKDLSKPAQKTFKAEYDLLSRPEKSELWDQADRRLQQAIDRGVLDHEWWRIANDLGLPQEEVFKRGHRLAGFTPDRAAKMWERQQNVERLIEDAKKRGTFFNEYTRIALLTGLEAREVYTLGISPPSLGVSAPPLASGMK